MPFRLCSAEFWRRLMQAQVSSSSSDRGSKLQDESQNNLRVASKRDINIMKIRSPEYLGDRPESDEDKKKKIPTNPISKKADNEMKLSSMVMFDEYNIDMNFQKQLKYSAERNYSTTAKEAPTVAGALEKPRGYLEETEVTVPSDHQPLRSQPQISNRKTHSIAFKWITLYNSSEIFLFAGPSSSETVQNFIGGLCGNNNTKCSRQQKRPLARGRSERKTISKGK
ncbi:hypothetical protein AVEN_162614-1 [Araneus ventricosus]|uniref:Reverse transcriptase RNase H-like domain-containing protein n=1 Tax=Araneus ventricosus TaxID=182803 RepID=A0A4Y2MV40_ARAVE|nr:hypothetical protein AVEN_162614-1 [Araneus ventricosus]